MEIKTYEIKLNFSKLSVIVFLEYGKKWVIASLPITFLLVSLSFIFGYQYAILALMWNLLILPFIILFSLIFYGLKPLTSYNILLHHVSFFEHRLKIEWTIESEGNENKNEIEIDYSLVRKIKLRADSFIIFFRQPNEGLICIPYSVLPKQSFLNIIINHLTSYKTSKTCISYDII